MWWWGALSSLWPTPTSCGCVVGFGIPDAHRGSMGGKATWVARWAYCSRQLIFSILLLVFVT
ncbi:hypothetical protein [Pasteuria penetrans]|uniref:hypothetical protein n=1 Tax=Pasteuria penetrans TaxID=86005 RepID=UPI0011EF8C54|nr:hypothetical protein [Pasteuria penetrans]